MSVRADTDRLGRVLTLTTAVAMLVVALLLGLMPLKVDGVGCGSAFVAGDYYSSPLDCSQLRSFMLPFALSAVSVAVVFGLATIAFAPSMVDAAGDKNSSPV